MTWGLRDDGMKCLARHDTQPRVPVCASAGAPPSQQSNPHAQCKLQTPTLIPTPCAIYFSHTCTHTLPSTPLTLRVRLPRNVQRRRQPLHTAAHHKHLVHDAVQVGRAHQRVGPRLLVMNEEGAYVCVRVC